MILFEEIQKMYWSHKWMENKVSCKIKISNIQAFQVPEWKNRKKRTKNIWKFSKFSKSHKFYMFRRSLALKQYKYKVNYILFKIIKEKDKIWKSREKACIRTRDNHFSKPCISCQKQWRSRQGTNHDSGTSWGLKNKVMSIFEDINNILQL